jgi:hypothetical protein
VCAEQPVTVPGGAFIIAVPGMPRSDAPDTAVSRREDQSLLHERMWFAPRLPKEWPADASWTTPAQCLKVI